MDNHTAEKCFPWFENRATEDSESKSNLSDVYVTTSDVYIVTDAS